MIRTTSGASRVAGVVGQPIDQSLSPLLHNAWIAAAGLDAAYVPFGPQTTAGFEALVAAGRDGALVGMNVTAPFKGDALRLADRVSECAGGCGSANLLTFRDNEVFADSTDGLGLIVALKEQAAGLNISERPVVVLGAGGAARAAVAALRDAGANDVRICNRTAERAWALAERFEGVKVEDERTAFSQACLVVNALSAPTVVDLSALPGDAVVMDMTYRPLETDFLAAAKALGLTTVDGLAMLIGQARPSFEALFGVPVPDIDIRGLALAHIGEPAS